MKSLTVLRAFSVRLGRVPSIQPCFALGCMAAVLLASLMTSSTAKAADAFYVVKVVTGGRDGAGTDSDINLKLYGLEGETDYLEINPRISGNAFEEGESDRFTWTTKDIGPITKIRFQKDTSGVRPDWFLSYIQVAYFASDSSPNKLFLDPQRLVQAQNDRKMVSSMFKCERWIKGDERLDEKNEGVELYRAEAPVAAAGDITATPSTIYVISYIDALSSENRQSETETYEVSTSKSLSLEDHNSDRVKLAAGGEYSYSSGSHKGKVTLNVEYEHLSKTISKSSNGSTNSLTREYELAANPGEIQFKIMIASGTVYTRNYRSALRDSIFTAVYATPAQDVHLRGATLTRDDAARGTQEWNNSIARPFALAQGQANYEALVNRLDQLNCLNKNQVLKYEAIVPKPQ